MELRDQLLDFEAHFLAKLRVEIRQGLVEQEDSRPVDKRARQADALLLPAGKLSRIPIAQLVHAHQPQRVRDPLSALGMREVADHQAGNPRFHSTVRCGNKAKF